MKRLNRQAKNKKMCKKITAILICFFLAEFCLVKAAVCDEPSPKQSKQIQVYTINKKVSEFPVNEDFSTPEAAYATINRLGASGDLGFWRRVSTKELAQRMPVETGKKEPSKIKVQEFMNAEILEVRVFDGTFAYVLAKLPYDWKTVIDCRAFELEDGRWLNTGNDVFDSVEKAQRKFETMCEYRAKKPARGKIENPEEYLKPYVEFLKNNAGEPKSFVMKALAKNKIVIIGETHHRPLYWNFNFSLVSEPEFAKYIGTIYLELPSNDQELIDRFLAAKECNTEPVIRMLRDMLEMGWPDKPMLDFFAAVWKANQKLEPEQRIRIVLVDMERPWEKIQNREDWRTYDVDRDKYMADNILKDIRNHPEGKRNNLFIVGVGHTSLNFAFYGGHPLKTAGWYLREGLGQDKVFAIMQHRCVMTNMGQVDGRLCLGLFDSVFAALDNRPVAFMLEEGPFGKQMYDGEPDVPVWSKYRDGFNAYLYLGPLETESFSSLIPGFYTDDFFKEIERRYRLMYGKSWSESYNRQAGAKSFVEWMSGSGGSWGQPRKWRTELGPIDAWKFGDNWEEETRREKRKFVLAHPEVIKTAAKNLFDAIKNADYEHHKDGSDWQNFLPEGIDYQVHHHFDSWVRWVCKTFKENPIESVELGEVTKGQDEMPAISYKVTLRDGRELKGILPFKYMPRQGVWMGVQGIDWHLQFADSSESEKKAAIEQVKEKPPVTATTESIKKTTESKTVDRSSPEATIKIWTKAVATGNVEDAMACMLPGGVDYENVKKILNAETSSPMFTMKKMWESIDVDKPIRILGKKLVEDEAKIDWEFSFKKELTIEGHTFKAGDTFKFDATLKKRGDCWLLDDI
jgi:hypothetical protein